MVSFARVLEKGDEGVSMEEEDLFMRSMKKVKEDQKEKGSGDDVSYADNEGCSPYVQSKGGNMTSYDRKVSNMRVRELNMNCITKYERSRFNAM